MTFLLAFLKEFWKPIAIVLIVAGTVFYVYEKGVSAGFKKCEDKYTILIQQRDAAINDKIEKLASGSIAIANETKKSANTINKQLQEIAAATKGPLVIYKDGKCEPSQAFVDAVNAINGAANVKK